LRGDHEDGVPLFAIEVIQELQNFEGVGYVEKDRGFVNEPRERSRVT
jgi:hypothetical protein